MAACLCLVACPMASRLRGQEKPAQQVPAVDAPQFGVENAVPEPLPTMFPRFDTDRIWLSAQANFISQYHPTFASPYSGKNSLSAEAQDATSRVLTLFMGLRLTSTAELLFDVQETGGNGIGSSVGVAGFPNLDVVRNPTLGKAPYIARLMWHQIIPLGRARAAAQRNPFALFSTLPERRLEVRFGKFSMADFFDVNSYGTDTNFQFVNWTVDNNGAYDSAADTRGYTFAGMLEYHDRRLAVRFAEALLPKVANGIHLDAELSRARADNLEFELHGKVLRHREGILRLLSFVNHANMGSYSQAIADFLNGPRISPPSITAHPLETTVKYGFGVNFEQPLNSWFGVFGRWGWNEGQHESYVYTEVDETGEIGAAGNGKAWRRKFDRAGVVFVSNGISRDHQEYLALGGNGFLLGDGRLRYGRETIFEGYYTFHAWRGFYPSFGMQHINNPGYNRDRGPVLVPSLRLHMEF